MNIAPDELASTSPKTNNFILFLGEFHSDDFRKSEAFQMFWRKFDFSLLQELPKSSSDVKKSNI